MKKSKIVTFILAAATLLVGCQQAPKLTSITLTADDKTLASDTYDIVFKSDTAETTATFTYTDANVAADFSWISSNKDVCTVSKGSGTNQVKIKAKGSGEAEVYVTSQGINSNALKVKVNGLEYKTNDDFKMAKTTYINEGNVEKPLNMNTIYSNQNAPHLDPLVEQHVLVVPFGFTDDNLQAVQNAETIERIRKTFFGTSEELAEVGGWESLASFYNKSSYGLSEFKGNVLNTWCVYPDTAAKFTASASGGQGIKAAEYIRNWYVEEYAKENHGDLGADAEPFTYYDANKDGFLDLVWVVYSHPTDHSNQTYWAYVTYTSNAANKSKPAVKTLGWASIDWMNTSCNGYDPHTFIHETGHTYGLDDYYDYNNMWRPMGRVDFMDNNLGDHSMFSKFTLGWTSPWVVDDAAEITLRPGTTTGDCFIIPSQGYNGTAFDEYLMVELMAPVGLAEKDYKNGYESTVGYSEPGIRITHVDARVYETSHDTYCVDNPQKGRDFRVCNTKFGRSGIKVDSDYYPVLDSAGKEVGQNAYTLISLIESSIKDNNWTNMAVYNATNNSLFTAGDKFNLSSKDKWASTFMPSKSNLWNKSKTTTGWKSATTQTYTFDETMTFNYSLKVLSITEDAEYGWVAKVRVTPNAY